MSRQPYRSELVDAEVNWLVTIRYAGRDFRFSTRPLSVTNDDGDTLAFEGGLPEVQVEQVLAAISDAPELLSVSLDLVFPVDVAELVAQGHDLSAATGEVALHVEGTVWEDRYVLLDGKVTNPLYGAEDEEVSFSVVEMPYEDGAIWPDAGALVTRFTWPDHHPDHEGRVYPTVGGAPGRYRATDGTTETVPGSPALIVEWTGTASDKWLIAGHEVAASTVTVFGGDDSASVSVTHEADGKGRTVAVVDVSGESTAIRQATDVWVGWPSAGGLLQDHGTDGMEGAGDTLLWWLRRSSLRIDEGAIQGMRETLNAYTLGWYTDEPVTPWEWVQDNLLPILPLWLRSGLDGLYPVLWRWRAGPEDAVEHIEAGPGVVRPEGARVEYIRQPSDIRNEIRLSWAVRPDEDNYLRETVITPDPDPLDPEQFTNVTCRASYHRYGEVRVQTLETDVVYDEDTATRILFWKVAALGFAQREVSYEVGQEFGWLELGQPITLTDTDLHLDEHPGLVAEMTANDTGRWDLTIELREHFTHENRVTGDAPQDGGGGGGP